MLCEGIVECEVNGHGEKLLHIILKYSFQRLKD